MTLLTSPPSASKGRTVRHRAVTGRWIAVSLVLLAGIAVLMVLSIAVGTGYPIPPTEVVRSVFGGGDEDARWVVFTLRMPRTIAAALVGAALGVSGGILQGLSRNVLASPDLIGFSAGAATGGLIQILVLDAGPLAVAIGAVLGGLGTAALVLLLSRRAGSGGTRLVLIGVGMGALLTAVNGFLLTRADAGEALSAAVWLTGSLNVRTWAYVVPAAIVLGLTVPFVVALSRPLRMLELGDDTAIALGVSVRRARPMLVALSVLLVAVAVAVAVAVGVVALAAPQIARRLARSPSMVLVPAGLLGALLLVGSDVIAMRVIAPAQLPVGIVTAAVGGLYLVWLLSAQWRAGRG